MLCDHVNDTAAVLSLESIGVSKLSKLSNWMHGTSPTGSKLVLLLSTALTSSVVCSVSSVETWWSVIKKLFKAIQYKNLFLSHPFPLQAGTLGKCEALFWNLIESFNSKPNISEFWTNCFPFFRFRWSVDQEVVEDVPSHWQFRIGSEAFEWQLYGNVSETINFEVQFFT